MPGNVGGVSHLYVRYTGSIPVASTMTVKQMIDRLKESPEDAEVWFDEKHTDIPVTGIRDGFVADIRDGYGDVIFDEEDFAYCNSDKSALRRLHGRKAVILD